MDNVKLTELKTMLQGVMVKVDECLGVATAEAQNAEAQMAPPMEDPAMAGGDDKMALAMQMMNEGA